MSRKLVAWAFVWPLLCAFGASVASAREPEAVFWRVLEAVREGPFHPGLTPGGDTQVLVELFPSDDQFRQQHLLVVFPGCGEDPSSPNRPVLNLEEVLRRRAPARYPSEWEDPGPRWRVCPAESAYLLEGEAQQLSLSVDFLRAVGEGVSPRLLGEVHVLSEDDLAKIDPQKDIGCQWASVVGRRAPAAQLSIDLYYRLSDKGSFVFGEYADVFGRPGPDPVKDARMTGDYQHDAAGLQVDLLSFHSDRLIPAQTRDDGGRLFRKTLEDARRAGTALVGSSFCTSEDFQVGGRRHRRGGDDDDDGHCEHGEHCRGEGVLDPGPDLLPQAAAPVTNLATYHVSGRFSTKWSADHSLHPGFGFRVEAWTDDLLPGVFVRLASDWVQADGTWSLTLPPTFFFSGHRLRMLYVTRTDYYDAQDINGNHYAWRDPDWLNIPTTFDVGHRFADTDGGTFNGVGEMVDAAMYTWSRLYWNGGLNPVRSSPINLIAPNTGLACGGTSPWSCASGGSIWLIAAHAAQAQVVSHELGHQLNFKFWNDKRPANTGGSHSLNSCYPSRLGMTLFEGFADFLAGWVGYPGRNVADGGFGSGRWALGWDLEPRTTPPSCTNGWENETWVARTFWDLHDTHGDGNDVLWFNSLGAVPALYLGNGVANDGDARDMRDYRTIYRNAASPGHQTYISDIFDQNRQ